jgi:hypothetical protein
MSIEFLGEPQVFTTGAYLRPIKINTHHGERYVWVVDAFEDDTYLDGDYIDPDSTAKTIAGLVEKFSDEEEAE